MISRRGFLAGFGAFIIAPKLIAEVPKQIHVKFTHSREAFDTRKTELKKLLTELAKLGDREMKRMWGPKPVFNEPLQPGHMIDVPYIPPISSRRYGVHLRRYMLDTWRECAFYLTDLDRLRITGRTPGGSWAATPARESARVLAASAKNIELFATRKTISEVAYRDSVTVGAVTATAYLEYGRTRYTLSYLGASKRRSRKRKTA